MHGRLNLRERLMVLMVAAILPLFAHSLWLALRESRSATEMAQSQLRLAASLLAANQDRAVDAAEQLLGSISARPDLRGEARNHCQNYFEQLRERYPVYASIGLRDREGQVLCEDKGHHAGSADLGTPSGSYVQTALSQRRFAMGEPMTGSSGAWVIPFASPVIDAGHVTGVVFATLNMERTITELVRTQLPAGASVMVVNRRGQLLLEYPQSTQPAAARERSQTDLVQAALSTTTGVGEDFDAGGQARLYAVATTRVVGSEGFVVRVGLERSAVIADASDRLRDALLVLAATLLAAIGATWWIGGRAIVTPARQLLGAVRRLEQGRLEVRVPLQSGAQRGEFARIGAAFNLMAESLQLRQMDVETELGRSRSAYAVLDLVLNSMQDALIAVTSEGQFLMFNEAATQLFPLSGPQPQPAHWAEHLGFFYADGTTPYESEDLPLVRSALGESGRQQLLFVRNSQVPEGRLLQCSWQPIGAEGGTNGGLAVFTDVTELQRLQAEQAAQFEELRETQRRLIEAQRIGHVGNWELDLYSGRLWWSEAVYGLFGITPDQFDATVNGVAHWIHPQDQPLLKPARDAALRDGKVMSVEYRVCKPDGSVAWMHEIAEARRNDEGQPVWFGGVVQDITHRKKGEQALLESERELQAYTLMLQRATDAAQAITAHASVQDILQELADQARRVVGSRYAAVDLSAGADGEAALHRVSGSDEGVPPEGGLAVPLSSGSGEKIGQLRLWGKDEGDFTERDEYVAMEIAQLASIALDNARLFTQIRELNTGLEARIGERTAELERYVAELKAIEGALRSSNQELEAFSYSVSHDLRSPLGAVGGFSRALALQLEGQADERTMHYLSRIQAGVDKMERLIDALLSLSRVVRAPLTYGAVDLSAMARETTDGLQTHQPGREVEIHVQEGLVAQGDAGLLRLVMENLLGNAWKFSSKVAQPRIEVGQLGNGPIFFVRDNGVGFDMQYADKLFGAFQRLHTEAEFPGTGIGLATVRRVVARHQGKVWAESQPGQGTTFFFVLPPSAPPAWLVRNSEA